MRICTHSQSGINLDVANDLEKNWTHVPSPSPSDNVPDTGMPVDSETIAVDELEAEFERFQRNSKEENLEDVEDNEVLKGEIYNFKEFERDEKGEMPTGYAKEVNVVEQGMDKSWDISLLMPEKRLTLT
ncbi:hypothetical protein PsYK624_052650 [Phanerochaete sordida]|uniref:Uncharacterized protein n=1 Tax=Phanerochaete sordida TaxID=48140 RepID=A0A9P3LBG2_9APHY|nr:hypothetical protein PsYK624_052650 [Phanerochaete sordida]